MQVIGKDKVNIEILLDAPIENVWQAWTDPVIVAKWFGSDPGGKVLNAELDVRIGGNFTVTFRDSDLTEHTCSGFYKELQELWKLTFTWCWKSEPGVESLVTVSLTPENDKTMMHFEHAHLGNASMHNYLQGWNATFLKLQKALDKHN